MIQQTIQEVKFEDIILSKKQRQARRTNKLRHWLEYLNMLDENNNHQKKNETIKELHSMFILRQDFWIREVNRVLQNNQNFSVESFEFALMALDDGHYIRVAKLIGQKLFEAYIAQKLRITFVIAKLQIMIAKFDHLMRDCSDFFEILIKIYYKTNNTKKIRQTYLRQISMGFDDYDVAYALYIQWQKTQQTEAPKTISQILQKAKTQWQDTQVFMENQLLSVERSGDLILSEELKANKKNVKRCIVHLENMNRARVDERKYIQLVQLLNTNTEKLWYLRRLALSQTHQLVEQYLQTLQLSGAEDDQIISAFKNSFNWENGYKYEPLYLSFLIQRINKHLSKSQDEEYNNTWGQNVEFFRNQISQLISKERFNLGQQKELVTKYYYLWIEVQASLVKDSPTVQQIFQNLLGWVQSEEVYILYAQFMVRLGDIAKARWIFNKTCQAQSYQGKIVQQYETFLKIYGSLEESIKLREKIKEKNVQKVIKVTHKVESHVVVPVISSEKTVSISQVKPIQKQVELITVTQKEKNQKVDNKPAEQKEKQKEPQKTEPKIQEQSFKRSAPVQTNNSEEVQNHHQKKKVHLDQQNTLFAKNLHKDWTQADIMLNIVFKESVNQVRIVQKQRSKFCYIEFDSEQNAQKQIKANKTSLNLAFSRPPSKSDNTTLFLCNLPLDTPKDKIQELIPQAYRQLIKQIRSKQKGDKKTAYIEFNDEQTRNSALLTLKKQKIKLDNRSIIALSCQSEFKNKDKKHKTIFLKNLSFKCKQKDIKAFFQEKGFSSVIEVFIPKDEKTNRPKGYAYVEFFQNEQVEKAVQLRRGELFNREFVISQSDRAITHQHESNIEDKRNEKRPQKPKPPVENKKSNNFFSNIFS